MPSTVAVFILLFYFYTCGVNKKKVEETGTVTTGQVFVVFLSKFVDGVSKLIRP
jgi:hypothetical protein